MNHIGTKRLETERLILRKFAPEDAPMVYRNWASDDEVTRFVTWPTHASEAVSAQIVDYWIHGYEQGHWDWAMELKETGEVIGSISVVDVNEDVSSAEIGYCMGRRWWGQGLMPEAAGAVTRYLLTEEGFNRVTAKHDVNNPKSGRVMQKIGMRLEGVHRQSSRNNQGIVDTAVYAILREDLRD